MQEEEKTAAAQAMPINCASAPGDLRVLNSEKASAASKIGNGILDDCAHRPCRRAGHRSRKDQYQVSTGEYNKALDTKIAQIKPTSPGAAADLGDQFDYVLWA